MTKSAANLSRRSAIAGLGASAFLMPAAPVWAQARSTLTTAARGTVSSCTAAEVATSDAAMRMSTVADFTSVGSCQMTPDTVEGPISSVTGSSLNAT